MSVSIETLILAKKYTDKIASEGISETLDYNNIPNIPIENKIGTVSSPINLSTLEFGEYIISGDYVYNETTENISAKKLYVSVFQDVENGKKIIKFEEFKNSNFYIVTLSYEEDGTYIEDRLSIPDSIDSTNIAKEVELLSF